MELSSYSSYSTLPGVLPAFAMQATDHDTPGTGEPITTAGTAHVKGSFTQLIASTPFRARTLYLQLTPRSGATGDTLIDIAVGPTGAETVIIANIPLAHLSGAQNWSCYYTLPVDIPAGTRISARSQGSATAHVSGVFGTLIQDSILSPLLVGQTDVYGVNPASSNGTVVDAGATVNTKGAWVQLSASITYPIYLLSCYHSDRDGHSNPGWFLFDIGVGAAGSEVVVVPNLAATRGGLSSNNQMVPGSSGPFPVNIPAGSRLSVRASCTNNNSTDRLCRFAVLGSR